MMTNSDGLHYSDYNELGGLGDGCRWGKFDLEKSEQTFKYLKQNKKLTDISLSAAGSHILG